MASFLKKLFTGGSPASGETLSHADRLARAHNELALKTGLHDRGWGIGGAAWAADLDAGILTFDAPEQVIGTLDTLAGTWMWGWDHPSVPKPLAIHAETLRDYGATQGLADYTTRTTACDEAKAWDFTALATLLNAAQGGYRGPAGTTLVFMTFGTVTMAKGAMKPTPETDLAAGLTPVEAPEVLALARGYCEEIFAIEKAYADLPQERREDAFEAAIAAQQPVYDRYWRRDDEDWRPASLSSRPESDLSLTRDWRVFSRSPDRWRVTYTRDIGVTLRRGFDVERFSDGLRIVDALF